VSTGLRLLRFSLAVLVTLIAGRGSPDLPELIWAKLKFFYCSSFHSLEKHNTVRIMINHTVVAFNSLHIQYVIKTVA
jgi:hypothetical protein